MSDDPNDPTNNFDAWCVVDLFGHARIAGKVTNQNIGSATFVRVDVYEGAKLAFTRFFHPNAVYGISPVTRAVAIATAKAIDARPVQAWDVPGPPLQRQLLGQREYQDD